jgi:hypothetical protein
MVWCARLAWLCCFVMPGWPHMSILAVFCIGLLQVRLHWQDGGPSEHMLVSHFTMPGRVKQMWTAASGQQIDEGAQTCFDT